MQPTPSEGNACNCKGTLVLLLFVGFIIGFSVGFASKDVILSTLTSSMVDSTLPPDERIHQNFSSELSDDVVPVQPLDEQEPTVSPEVQQPVASEEPAVPQEENSNEE